MLRVIFDTNIYGLLIKEGKIEVIGKKIADDTDFIVYGFRPIRKELRDTPKDVKLERLSTRNLLLNLYDQLTKKKYLDELTEIDNLARNFYKVYREFGGIRNWDKTNINVDFTLVACASFYKLDVVVSDDAKTLLSEEAKKAYKDICVREGRWQPNFWKYSDLKTRYNF